MASTPIFGATPNRSGALWVNGSTANTRNDGVGTIGTDIMLAYTAGASGAYIDRVRLHPVGLVAATATTPTVARIYLSTVASGATTATDTKLWQEVACPAQTTAQTTTGTSPIDIPMGIRLKASDTILVSMHHVAAANTGWQFNVIATDY